MKKLLALAPLLFLIAACAQLGLEAPQSFDERLAYAVAQNAGTRSAAAMALDAGRIGKKDAEAVLELTSNVRVLLDAAKLASSTGDVTVAEDRLVLALSLLQSLQVFLNERNPS